MDELATGGVTSQTAQNIVNVGTAGTVNIYQNGKNKLLNQYLTKVLMTAIQAYSDDAATFLDEHKDDASWNQKLDLTGEAQEYIVACYANVIGSQLMKLMAIGKPNYPGDQQTNYIDKCIAIAKTTLQLLCFALISDIWTQKKQKPFDLSKEETDELASFFKYSLKQDWNISQYMGLFTVLNGLYGRAGLVLPMPELAGFNDQLKPDNSFFKSCDQLCSIQKDTDINNYTDKNCVSAEQNLADFLVTLGFLATYKMVSIKSVNYDEARNNQPHYLHNYVELSAKNTETTTATGLKYVSDPVNTDSILLYKGNYMKGCINLFPFILDYNALNITGGVKICFYSSVYVDIPKKDEDDDDSSSVSAGTNKMRLYFPEDATKQEIAFAGIMYSFAGAIKQDASITAILKDDTSRIQFKKDTVFLQFNDAKMTILGTL